MKTPTPHLPGWIIGLSWLSYFIFFEATIIGGFFSGTGWPFWAWILWALATTTLFVVFSWDCVLLTIWAWTRLKKIPAPDPVPATLTEQQHLFAEQAAARLAVLIPAHKEAATPESALLFEERLIELMRVCPERSTLHVLFDSPDASDQQAERNSVTRIQTLAGKETRMPRLELCEYRDKPAHLRSKPGSLYLWLEKNRSLYDHLIIVDADTSFTPRDPDTTHDRDIVCRLLLAMKTTEPPPSLIQTNIQQTDPETITGWLEAEDGLSSPYYAHVMSTVYADQSPCFGHNFICRTDDLWHHIRIDYLSHDMIEAASMAGHDLHCHFSPGTITYESCEEPLPAWLKRDARWGRGCAQWILFVTRRRLPWRPRTYLFFSIGLYYAQIASALSLLLAALLVHQGGRVLIVSRAHAILVLLLIISTNLAPRLIAGRPPHIAVSATLLRTIISFGTIWWRTLSFIISPFGKGWTPRAARGTPTASAALASVLIMLPGSLAGLLIYILLPPTIPNFGTQILRIAAIILIAGPILGAAVSIPFRKTPTA